MTCASHVIGLFSGVQSAANVAATFIRGYATKTLFMLQKDSDTCRRIGYEHLQQAGCF
jgi:hypothetical protein